jgi:precorrin-6B methylase 2
VNAAVQSKPSKKWLRAIVPSALRPSAFIHRYIVETVTNGCVAAGLFKGMRLPPQSICGEHVPKFMGTYEIELLPVFERLRRMDFQQITVVGAAEGYYAFGCCLLWPKAQVTAFELTEVGRQLLAKYARKNGVEARLKINGRCSAETLPDELASRKTGLIIMDVEGAEAELLLADAARLAKFHILVEIHDALCPDGADAIQKTFSKSHQIEIIEARPREARDLVLPKNSLIRTWFAPEFLCHLNERPLPMRWFYLSPINGQSNPGA